LKAGWQSDVWFLSDVPIQNNILYENIILIKK